jgi:hypothetical protein
LATNPDPQGGGEKSRVQKISLSMTKMIVKMSVSYLKYTKVTSVVAKLWVSYLGLAPNPNWNCSTWDPDKPS